MPAINRRTAIKGLAVGSGAALLAACMPRASAAVPTSAPTSTPYPTATPYPTIAATATPDLGPAVQAAKDWFPIGGDAALMALKPGGRFSQALVAQVNGQKRAVAVMVDGQWAANVPRPPDSLKSSPEVDKARHDLADLGYGVDLQIARSGADLVGTPDTPALLRSDCYGSLYELPQPGGQIEVRWLGNAWEGGTGSGPAWQPPVPAKFDGTEKFFTGYCLITCDDCHDENDTRSILAVAEGIGAKMTFFPNTPYVKMFPQLFKDIIAGGHEIGFHTTTHSNGEWSPAYLESDCSYFEKTVRDVTGMAEYRVVTARPPYGLWYKGGWQDWVESKGIVTAMWSRTIGWDSTPKVIRRTITENGGLILLSHANPENVQWYKDNADLIAEFAPKYKWPTITQVLLKDWTPVKVVGLPTSMIAE